VIKGTLKIRKQYNIDKEKENRVGSKQKYNQLRMVEIYFVQGRDLSMYVTKKWEGKGRKGDRNFFSTKNISCARNFENIKERAKAKLKEPCHGKTMVVKQYQIQWSQGNFISFQFYQCKSAN
jgi:hypothetical protein